jgi:putative copper resistance protein D
MIEAALIASRWLQFAAAAVLCGVPAFALYGLPSNAREREAVWLKRWITRAAVLGVVAAIAMLLAQSAEMAGDPALAFDPETVWAVTSGTYFGTVWSFRFALLVLAIAFALALSKQRTSLVALVLVGAAAAASLAWIGHGGEGEGIVGGVHRLADVAHLLAAALWIGALVALVRLLRVSYQNDDDALHGLVRFSGIGPVVVAALIVTGLVNAWALAGDRPIGDAATTAYAFVLYVKLALFGAMLLLAALNRFQLMPKLAAAAADATARNEAIAALRRSVIAETVLAALVIAAVAALGVMEPPSAG